MYNVAKGVVDEVKFLLPESSPSLPCVTLRKKVYKAYTTQFVNFYVMFVKANKLWVSFRSTFQIEITCRF